MWAAIQDGYARTTPGKAIGFMFIPFFNIYWMFQAIWGYSKDYNNFSNGMLLRQNLYPKGFFLPPASFPG